MQIQNMELEKFSFYALNFKTNSRNFSFSFNCGFSNTMSNSLSNISPIFGPGYTPIAIISFPFIFNSAEQVHCSSSTILLNVSTTYK